MYVRPLSTLFLLLGVFLIAKANDFPEKIGLEQICERVVEEAKSMDVEDFLEQGKDSKHFQNRFHLLFVVSDQLLRTAEMCEKYLKDVNPDLNEVHLKSSGFEDKCILKVYSKGYYRGDQFDIEKRGRYSVRFPVESIRNVGNCCWRISRIYR